MIEKREREKQEGKKKRDGRLIRGETKNIKKNCFLQFNWTHFDTAERVNRSSFMLVLAKLNEMWITASYFTSGPGTYQTR